jgi:hypothetical protein
MEVRLFPNSRRPDVGLRPRREAQRPLLPQHARQCPVLEAGSSLGYMVYPPLEPNEAFKVGYEGEGTYRFVYYVNPTGANWEGILSIAVTLPAGGIGMFKEEVTFHTPVPTTTRENALLMLRAFIVPEDLGTPPGAVTLRGAWNFQTPAGWDTVYTPIFNMIERPVVPMMVVRVETDWYAHESEFRYVLQPGQALSVAHGMPIGQALFVPREQITLRDCSEEELAAIRRSTEDFFREKSASKITTSFGLQVSPHYLRTSRSQTASPVVQPSDTPEKIGRNDPCPCGSGRKYKRCHGQNA